MKNRLLSLTLMTISFLGYGQNQLKLCSKHYSCRTKRKAYTPIHQMNLKDEKREPKD